MVEGKKEKLEKLADDKEGEEKGNLCVCASLTKGSGKRLKEKNSSMNLSKRSNLLLTHKHTYSKYE
jgi:hypothetical protein